MQTVLKVESLKKHYGKEPNVTKALDSVSFQVMEGEFVGIMGASGSGKTTLLNCLASLVRPSSGKIFLRNCELSRLDENELANYRGRQIGYLFQNFELIENLTAKENIQLPLSLHHVSEKESLQRLKHLADQLDIEDIFNKFPSQMSGGQKQRVAAARALILNPEIVYADEPTGALDSKNASILMARLARMNALERTTILMVTHNAHAASFCNRIFFIRDGRIYHEIRRDHPRETQENFYQRILKVMAVFAGGEQYVF